MNTQDSHSPEPLPVDVQQDIQVMQNAQVDPNSFALIYERYFKRIYLYCLRHVNNPDEAEDLASQVFIHAFRSLPKYRGGVVSAWLFRIAYGTVANHYRKSRPEVSFEDKAPEIAADLPEPLERMVRAEAHDRLRGLIAQLSPEDRELLALKLDAGLSSGEIGEMMGKSAGAVRIQLHRIIKRLRAQYQQAEEKR